MKADTDPGTGSPATGRLGGMAPASGASMLRSRLFIKYVALFVAVVSLALIANGAFEIYFSYQEQKASLVRIQREQAEAAAGKIGQFISEIESQVGWTTQLPWSAATLEQRRFDALRLLRQVPAITELAEINSTGHEQLKVSRLAMEVVGSGNDMSKDPAFTEAVAHKVYFGPVYFRRESEPYMTLSLAGTRRDTGVSIAQVNLKLIWDVLSRIKFAGHGRAYVVDAAGRLIAHPDISLVLRNTDVSQLAQVKSARANVAGNSAEEVQEATDIEGRKVLTASAPVAPLGWHVFVETPVEEAYAPLYASIERTALVLLGALALAFAAGTFLVRRMVVPIQALRAGAARLGAGDLNQRIAIKTGDEVEALADQFNDMAGRLQESYADLEHKVELRTAELTESLEQQTATAEVLGVISSSPGDLGPVFAAMLEKAARICDASFGNIYRWDGEALHYVASHNTPEALVKVRKNEPLRPEPTSPLGIAIATKSTWHTADLSKDPAYVSRSSPSLVAGVELGGIRANLFVPMPKENELVGMFSLFRHEPRPFTDKQIELVQNFAAQAVIAIENTRLLTELRESLEQQTATSDLLSVISASPGDLEPVFRTMLENATQICQAQFGVLSLREGAAMRVVAMHNPPPAYAELRQREPTWTPTGLLARIVAQAVTTKRAVQELDLAAYSDDDPLARIFTTTTGARSFVLVPLLKEGEVIGASAIYRQEVRPFSDKQVELLTNFAAQAVIAIENARLLSELRESLARQTATSDILGAIAASPADAHGSLRKIAETTAQLFGAAGVSFRIAAGDDFGLSVGVGQGAEQISTTLYEDPAKRPTVSGRNMPGTVVRENRQIHIGNTDELDDEQANWPGVAVARATGIRTMVGTPLRIEGRAIGALMVYRNVLQPFEPAELQLLQSFAAQAVIAIENARLLNELRERTTDLQDSLARQTATSEILRVISQSPTDVRPVFDSIVLTAVRLLHCDLALVLLCDGRTIVHAAAASPEGPVVDPGLTNFPVDPSANFPSRAIVDKRMLYLPDWSLIDLPEHELKIHNILGVNASLYLPLLRQGECIGLLTLVGKRPNSFGAAEIAQAESFRDQALIAIENVRLFNETKEALEQQTATADVLKVISRSTFDLKRVLATLVESAARLCAADQGALFQRDGDVYRPASVYGYPGAAAEFATLPTLRPDQRSVTGRVALEGKVVHVHDVLADPEYHAGEYQKAFGYRTNLGVPLLRDGTTIGVFALVRKEVTPFTDKQIELVTTFADQAVIAMENARLFEAEQERTEELTELLEQQTATSEVLRVISSSPGDLQPVFDTLLANAVRICQAQFGNLTLFDGSAMRVAAMHNAPPAFEEMRRRDPVVNLKLSVLGELVRTRKVVHVADITAEEPYASSALAKAAGARTSLAVPMLRDDKLVGAIALYHPKVRPFTDKQVELLQSFAAQAVIAIENARLLSELRESLEQQTATAEVLEVISRSAFDLQAVFDTVVESSTRLCAAERGFFFRFDGEALRTAATCNVTDEVIAWFDKNPIRPDGPSIVGRCARTRRTVHVANVLADPDYTYGAREVETYRSFLAVPVLRGDELLGVLALYQTQVRPFTDKQIAVVETFADQAAIAIENVRLFESEQERTRELTESLEQQTATSDVLRVISSSPGDLAPVFAAMLDNAVRISGAKFGIIHSWDGESLRLLATHNLPPGFDQARRGAPEFKPGPKTGIRRMAATRSVVHIADLREDPAYLEEPTPQIVAAVEIGGVRTMLAVPMLKENEVVGAFTVYRQEVRAFTDKQIELVQNFAAQAVIAIENARLLTELRARTDELGRSVGELRALGEVSQAVNSTLDLETVLSTIVAKAVQLSNTDAGAVYVFDESDREFHLRATYAMEQDLIDALSKQHIGLDETNVAPVLTRHEPIQNADLQEETPNPINAITLRAGYRARLTAPLFRGNDVVGLLVVRRRAPGAFPQSTVDLIKTFAAQSVLAIQNARLFHEIEDKRRELEVAGQHKSQFLANMSHELRTPLNAIIGYSEILQEDAADVGQQGLVPDLKKIEGAGRHLLGLINDILDLSKIEAGKMDVFLEDVDVVPLLEEVSALIVPLAEKNGNTLELRPTADLGSMRTDRTKLKQSLLNILSNGSKFTQNGRLTLVAEHFEADRPMVRFAITDTGIGMNEEQLGRLFQAFTQADASTTKKYGGTGLGLAISRRFCQLLGGDITVTSRPGEGSTFTIELPVRSDLPAPVKPAETAPVVPEAGNAATVLIVDDNPAARELLTANLKSAGYRLVHAASGDEALALARSLRPDAITLDVMMPKPDGWDVLSALKVDPELCDIPVVMVSVAPDRGVGLSLGAADILTKPVDRARLTALVHRLVRREGPVLVVEDDADTRDMMRHTIEKLGFSAAEAGNGRAALAWLAEHTPPAMVLLDLMMPEMDGFAFLDAIAERPEWREIPVVVVTAKQLTAVERERLSRQARNVMQKATATRVDIAAAINEAVRRRPQRMPAAAK